jgi:FixJ family two-component response regulator
MGKVLILDDDEAIVAGLTMALEDEGLAVVGTTSPFYLPFLLRREQPDVVLIDLGMPTLRGERVFEALTPSLRGHTRFLVFSGRSDADLAAVAKETGAVDFIHKGDDFGAIVRRIKFWVSEAQGRIASQLEPHVAVISSQTSAAALVLRAAGYFVTQHLPGEVPLPGSDAIVIDAPRMEALHAWSVLKRAAVTAPVIVVTKIPVLFAPAVPIAPGAVSSDLVSVIDRMLARTPKEPAADRVA